MPDKLIGTSDYRSCSQIFIAAAFGVLPPAVAKWADCPRNPAPPPGKRRARGRVGGTYNLAEVIKYRTAIEVERALKTAQTLDPLLSADAPSRERYVAAKADLAEMERDERRGRLLDAQEVQAVAREAAAYIRTACDRIQRECETDGEIAHRIMCEALDNFEAKIASMAAASACQQ